MHIKKVIGVAAIAAYALTAAAQEAAQPKTAPPGEEKPVRMRALEAGARLFQSSAPLRGFDLYLNGFHSMKDRPEQQMEAHHYCRQVNQDFTQCVLFDGNTATANMNGIEYIISEKLFNTLPEQERKFWHPHNGEILSGQLIAPGIPDAAERELMREKMNSYGKTWHVWNTGQHGLVADKLPLGEPMLSWSINRDGELSPELLTARDKRLNINTAEKRKQRAELRALAKPQSGVDDLKGKLGRPSQDIPGVTDLKAAVSAKPGMR